MLFLKQLCVHYLQLSLERDEHKLVIEQLSTLESERKAFRLIGGILVEKTVGEALPAVEQNYEGVSDAIEHEQLREKYLMLCLILLCTAEGASAKVGWELEEQRRWEKGLQREAWNHDPGRERSGYEETAGEIKPLPKFWIVSRSIVFKGSKIALIKTLLIKYCHFLQ